VKYIDSIGRSEIEKHEHELNRFLTEEMSNIEGLKIIGPQDPEFRGGIVSFIVDGMDVHEIALMLNNIANVMIRSGQHCVHSWFNAQGIKGSARVSLYIYNTKEEAETFIDNLKNIVKLR
jgi:cysteine desulfurase/selenocysteine lyase